MKKDILQKLNQKRLGVQPMASMDNLNFMPTNQSVAKKPFLKKDKTVATKIEPLMIRNKARTKVNPADDNPGAVRIPVKSAMKPPTKPQTETKSKIVRNTVTPNPSEFSRIQTVPCQSCGRSFADDRIQKHTQICKGLEKRPVFDPKKVLRSNDRCAPRELILKLSDLNLPFRPMHLIRHRLAVTRSNVPLD
jgi:zinc-finger of a C2HC-type